MSLIAILVMTLGPFLFPCGRQEPAPPEEMRQEPEKEKAPAGKPDREPEKPPAPPEEELHVVEKGNLVPTLELDSTFEPVEPAEVRIRLEAYSGELKLLSVVPHGSLVRKGDLLLKLDSKPIERMIAAAESDLRVARAALRKAEEEAELAECGEALALTEAQNALRKAENDLRIFDDVGSRHLLQQVDLFVKMYEDHFSDLREELDQLEKMYASEELTNATAEIVVRRARRELERFGVRLGMARENARTFREVEFPEQRKPLAAAVERSRQAVESLKIAQAQARVQREAEQFKARAAVEQQAEQLEKLRQDLAQFTVVAPFDGRVFYGQFQQGQWGNTDPMLQQLRPGEKVQAQQVLLTVCGPRLAVAADLPEAQYPDVVPGQDATVAPAAFPDLKIPARVRRKGVVSRSRGPGPSFELDLELKEQKPELLPGMKGKTTLTGEELRDVVLVPSQAVTASGSKHTVNVSRDGKTTPREVVVGKTDGKRTQIKSGLEAGEKIVLPKP